MLPGAVLQPAATDASPSDRTSNPGDLLIAESVSHWSDGARGQCESGSGKSP
jgi:hypothetical protein